MSDSSNALSALDALAIDTEATHDVRLYHPRTQEPLLDENGRQAVITIVGPDSAAYRGAHRKIQNRRLEQANKGRGRAKVTAEELEAAGNDILVAVTRGWHLVSLDGKALPVPFSPDTARKLYADPRFAWIKEQVDADLGNRADFIDGSPTT